MKAEVFSYKVFKKGDVLRVHTRPLSEWGKGTPLMSLGYFFYIPQDNLVWVKREGVAGGRFFQDKDSKRLLEYARKHIKICPTCVTQRIFEFPVDSVPFCTKCANRERDFRDKEKGRLRKASQKVES